MSTQFPVPRQTREAFVTASGDQFEFGPFDFILFDDEDVEVFKRAPGGVTFENVTADTNVAPVSIVPPYLPGNFSIVFAEGLEAGTELWVKGARTHERLFNVTQGGAIRGAELEKELDRQAIVLQELRRDVDREFPAPGDAVRSNDIRFIVRLTQAEFSALPSPEGDTLYIIIG